MHNFLKITSIGPILQSQTGQEYAVLKVKKISMLENGTKIFSNEKDRTRTIFGQNGDYAANPLFLELRAGNLKLGDLIEGTTQTFKTYPYQPEGYDKPLESTTVVVFSGEDGEKLANRQLKPYYSTVVDPLTGNLSAPEQIEKPITRTIKTIEDLVV